MTVSPQRVSRLFTMARGLGSLLVLAGLLIGLPIVLGHVAGNPIPQQLPSLEEFGDALARPASDDTLILTVIRGLAWLLWVLLCASTLLEVVAYARGHHAPRLPGLGSVQLLTRKLITSIALMTSTPSAVVLAAGATPPAVSAPMVMAAAEDRVAPDRDETSKTVRRGDTLWAIAERELGDGHRWKEIARLNEVSDPRELRPGQVLQLPSRDQPPPTRPPARDKLPGQDRGHPGQGEPTAPTPPVQPRPDDSRPTPGPAESTTASRSQSATPPPSTDSPVSEVVPSASSTPSRTPLSPTPVPNSSSKLPETTFATPAANHEQDTSAPWELVSVVFATGMVAGGMATRLALMRQVQRQHRRRGRRIRLPHTARANHTERRLARQMAESPDTHHAGRILRVALRALAEGLRQNQMPAPAIVGVHLNGGVLEVLLAEPGPQAPPLFAVRPGSHDMCWQLTPDGHTHLFSNGADEGLREDEDGTDPLPGLITAGRTSSGGHFLVNLEALGVIGCSGPDELVDATLRTIATEAATNPWSGWFDVLLVGFDELGVTEGRVHTCDDLDQALDLLAWRSDGIRQRLDREPATADAGDVRDRRLLGHNDDELTLTLLISRIPASPEQVQQMLTVVDHTGGVAAVLPADPDIDLPARFTLRPSTTDESPSPTLRIDPLQVVVRPHPLSAEDYDDIVELLTAAADLNDVAADQPPYTASPSEPNWPSTGQASEREDRQGTPALNGNGTGPSPKPGESSGGVLLFPQPSNATDKNDTTQGDQQADAPWSGRIDLTPSHPCSQPEFPDDIRVAGAPRQEQTVEAPPQAETEVTGQEAAPPADPAPGLKVRVLGPLEVTGSKQALQPKQVEIVLLLALNGPSGLRNDQLRTLLGPDPDHPKGSDSFRQAITRTRRRLGVASDGQERIQHVGDGVYRLHDVELDWSRFESLVEEAINLGASGAGALRQALDLVRGRPLEGCYHWWIDTPLLETMRATIVDAAELLAELDLAAGNVSGAGRAARKGLTADPAAEQLWRMLMRAEHAVGNAAGVHEAWSGCLRELAVIDADLEPHPDTVTLYQQLTSRPTTTSSSR
ncbi:BTAD domain-containing putative transcriptional regulator [Actinomadura viridis]|uniref:BTAD domain-containing putative transcriptional regulator n=1 Tax=Actinomadura viridis TaxID=58110 RepID=UPI00368D6E6E